MRFLSLLLAALTLSSAVTADDRPIFLVTSSGVWRSEIVNGRPGPWAMVAADVIVRMGDSGGGDNDEPAPPPPADPVVDQVAAISGEWLRTTDEAQAAAVLVRGLIEREVKPERFVEAMELGAPIFDTGINAGGRLTKWAKAVLQVTQSPAKILAGVVQQFGLDFGELTAAARSAVDGSALPAGLGFDFSRLLELLQKVLEVLDTFRDFFGR